MENSDKKRRLFNIKDLADPALLNTEDKYTLHRLAQETTTIAITLDNSPTKDKLFSLCDRVIAETTYVYLVELREVWEDASPYPPTDCTVMHVASTRDKALKFAQDNAERDLKNCDADVAHYHISREVVDGNTTQTEFVAYVLDDGSVETDELPQKYITGFDA